MAITNGLYTTIHNPYVKDEILEFWKNIAALYRYEPTIYKYISYIKNNTVV